MFADDTKMPFSSKETDTVENTINIEMSNIHMFLCTTKVHSKLTV